MIEFIAYVIGFPIRVVLACLFTVIAFIGLLLRINGVEFDICRVWRWAVIV